MSAREVTRVLNALFLGCWLGTLWGFGCACMIWWLWQVGVAFLLVGWVGFMVFNIAVRWQEKS